MSETGFQFGEDRQSDCRGAYDDQRTQSRRTISYRPKAYVLRLWAAVLGWFTAALTGALYTHSTDWIQTTDTASGAVIAMSQPPATWWYSIGTGVLAMLFIVAAMSGRAR